MIKILQAVANELLQSALDTNVTRIFNAMMRTARRYSGTTPLHCAVRTSPAFDSNFIDNKENHSLSLQGCFAQVFHDVHPSDDSTDHDPTCSHSVALSQQRINTSHQLSNSVMIVPINIFS